MSLPDEFYVSLASDECREFFHSNTRLAFLNKLPKPLLFEQNYCVALTEIHIPPFSIGPKEEILTSVNNQKITQRSQANPKEDIPISLDDQKIIQRHPSIQQEISQDFKKIKRDVSSILDNVKRLVAVSNHHNKETINLIKNCKNLQPSSTVSSSSSESVSQSVLSSEQNESVSEQHKEPNEELTLKQSETEPNVKPVTAIDDANGNVAKPINPTVKQSSEVNPKIATALLSSLQNDVVDREKSGSQSSEGLNLLNENLPPSSSTGAVQSILPTDGTSKKRKLQQEEEEEDSSSLSKVGISTSKLTDRSKLRFRRILDDDRMPDGSLIIWIDKWMVVIPPDNLKLLRTIAPVSTDMLLTIFLANLYIDNEDRPDNEHIRRKLYKEFVDISEDLQWQSDYYIQSLPEAEEKNFFMLNVPIDVDNINAENPVFDYRPVFVRANLYFSIKEFMMDLFDQIPYDQKRGDLLMKSIEMDEILHKPIKITRQSVQSVDVDNKNVDNDNDEESRKKRSEKRSRREYKVPIMSNYVQMLHVSTDIICPHAYAYRQLKLLRVIPFSDDVTMSGLHLRFEHLEFFPLIKNYFDSIAIKITNRDNEITFQEDIQPIYLQLFFKKCVK